MDPLLGDQLAVLVDQGNVVMAFGAGPNEAESYASGVNSLDWISRNFKELANAVG